MVAAPVVCANIGDATIKQSTRAKKEAFMLSHLTAEADGKRFP
jgi:hypothetical protein